MMPRANAACEGRDWGVASVITAPQEMRSYFEVSGFTKRGFVQWAGIKMANE
jgi:hypothetical protein